MGSFLKETVVDSEKFQAKLQANIDEWVQPGRERPSFSEIFAALDAWFRDGKKTETETLFKSFPLSHCLSFLPAYAMARFAAEDGNVSKTDEFLRLSSQRIILHSAEIQKVGIPFPVQIVTQSIYLDESAYGAPGDPAVFNWQGVPTQISGEIVVLASCNGIYFDYFAKDFTESFRHFVSPVHLHFHIINPTQETASIFSNLKWPSSVTASISTESGPNKLVFFACRRFELAPQLIRRWKKPLLITDLDVLFTESANDLLQLSKLPVDGGVFEISRTHPMLICHCSLSFFRETAESIEFLEKLAHYISLKLEECLSLWTLDQCALFVASRTTLREGSKFRWRDLKKILSADLSQFQIERKMDLKTKERLRLKGDAAFGNFEARLSIQESGRIRAEF